MSDDESECFFIVWKEHNHTGSISVHSLHMYGALSRNEKSTQDESVIFLALKEMAFMLELLCLYTVFMPHQRCSQTPAGRPLFAFS